MNLSALIDKIVGWSIWLGLPVVQYYHVVCDNVFLNVAREDACGIEKIANYVLVPVHYLLAGKKAVLTQSAYQIVPEFEYGSHFLIKTATSLVALPLSLSVGSLLKTAAYLSEETRMKHKAVYTAIYTPEFVSNNPYYQSIGINTRDVTKGEMIAPPTHKRRPGEESCMKEQKEALSIIAAILKEHKILFWVDCGTCLGTYRYGGVIPWDWDLDIAILAPDFDHVRRLLTAFLDAGRFGVQDWSGRDKPGSYLKVFVKGTDTLIDIYHFAIDAEKKEISSIFSNEESPFFPASMKIRERRYCVPTPFHVVFPLKRGMLDGIEVPVPNQTKRYLQYRYGENIEPAKIYDPITGNYEKDLSHPYWQVPHVH
jgi:hypothetical protein